MTRMTSTTSRQANVNPALPDTVHVRDLHHRLGVAMPFNEADASLGKPLTQWRMEDDDQPIFRYVYRTHRPGRHLEFGTWQGTGAMYCLTECDATVWTLNLPDGELRDGKDWTYCQDFAPDESLPAWANTRATRSGRVLAQTDAGGFIGRYYREANLGHRVCQIYCDSQHWDTSQFPQGFFDSVLIDGGHTAEIVASDTRKALPLLRPGGVVMWHDYCLDEQVQTKCGSVHGPREAVASLSDLLQAELRDLFWITPSWILLGIKA